MQAISAIIRNKIDFEFIKGSNLATYGPSIRKSAEHGKKGWK